MSACPEGGGGASGGPAGPLRYLCTNGTAVDGTTDATTDSGRTRCQRCNLLYKLNGAAGAIGTSCQQVALGEATRIGAAVQFDVTEDFPYDLAAIGATLYMAGGGKDVLYTLDRDTGRATQVGSLATGFGVREGNPLGLAAIEGTLYMVGASNDMLYTLNITASDGSPDGMAYQVGSLAAGFGVDETFPAGLAAIGATLYMVGAENDVLYTLNIDPGDTIADGSADQVGSLAAGFGVGETGPTGLASIGITLYMVGSNDVLYSIDRDTGRATQVGSLAAGFGVREGNPLGLAAIEGTLYMVGARNDALYVLRYQ